MTDRNAFDGAFDLDTALAELVRDAAENTPRPGADLTARVLADAAAVSAARPAARPAPPQRRRWSFSGFDALMHVWGAGAAAAMVAALVVGMGVGMQVDMELPMDLAEDDGPIFLADAGLLPEDLQ